MKGDVVVVKVKPGDHVETGQVGDIVDHESWWASFTFVLQVVAVISAMKMEMAVQSQINGVVRATHVEVGDKIDPEDLLVEIEEDQWSYSIFNVSDIDQYQYLLKQNVIMYFKYW